MTNKTKKSNLKSQIDLLSNKLNECADKYCLDSKILNNKKEKCMKIKSNKKADKCFKNSGYLNNHQKRSNCIKSKCKKEKNDFNNLTKKIFNGLAKQ